MKNKQVSALLLLLLLAVSSNAQEKNAPGRNNFYMAPLQMIVNTFEVGYERENTKGNGFLTSANAHFKKDNSRNELGFGIEFQYRISLYQKTRENGKTSGYFSPFLQGSYFDRYERYYYPYGQDDLGYYIGPYPRQHNTIISMGAGTVFGLKLSLQRFLMDFYLGGGFKYPVSTNGSSDRYSDFVFDPNYAGVYPKAGIRFGIAF